MSTGRAITEIFQDSREEGEALGVRLRAGQTVCDLASRQSLPRIIKQRPPNRPSSLPVSLPLSRSFDVSHTRQAICPSVCLT